MTEKHIITDQDLSRVVGGTAGQQIQGTSNNDSLTGGAGADLIESYNARDRVDGQGGDDVILTGDGNDDARGGAGHDVIYGGSGQDLLFGNAGSDELNGERDDDKLVGGTGADVISGGHGYDLVLWRPGDGDDLIDGGADEDTLCLELTPAELDRLFGLAYPSGGADATILGALLDALRPYPGSATPTVTGGYIDLRGFAGEIVIGNETLRVMNMERLMIGPPPPWDNAMHAETS
ncbi:calcium-binding protein [Falsiroseomonas sp.]|uniref:calcium-binding protein n=1 Tax=Falsiroseomonas sp. TaxID=2870721 RepID=UPI003F6F789A